VSTGSGEHARRAGDLKKRLGRNRYPDARYGDSLTITATALIDTGSRMDDVIFEEFKGTGNMEIHLDRKLTDKRVFPSIDMQKSGTRKRGVAVRARGSQPRLDPAQGACPLSAVEAMELLLDRMAKTKSNSDFLASMQKMD
jgi:transcription termination factor Rho